VIAQADRVTAVVFPKGQQVVFLIVGTHQPIHISGERLVLVPEAVSQREHMVKHALTPTGGPTIIVRPVRMYPHTGAPAVTSIASLKMMLLP
jgi:hypothetical protein